MTKGVSESYRKNDAPTFFHRGIGGYIGDRGAIFGAVIGTFFGAVIGILIAEFIFGVGHVLSTMGFSIIGAFCGAVIGAGVSARIGAVIGIGISNVFYVVMIGQDGSAWLNFLLIGAIVGEIAGRYIKTSRRNP